jgi:hypothetical protein
LAGREYNDIDLIVPERHMANAERILASLGYSSPLGNRAFRRMFYVYQGQYVFKQASRDAAVDLHWRFCAKDMPFPLQPDEIWNKLHLQVIGDVAAPTVANAELALLLAGHGTKEAWQCLKWVSDFAFLIERQSSLDWFDIYCRASAQGCGNAVLLACSMANELLEAPIPQALVEVIDRSSRVRVLTRTLTNRLRFGSPLTTFATTFADLELCDHRADRLKASMTRILTPTVGDLRAMPLPKMLWPAYYVTRPFRLAAKGIATVIRTSSVY